MNSYFVFQFKIAKKQAMLSLRKIVFKFKKKEVYSWIQNYRANSFSLSVKNCAILLV
jgi:hypothetical protein